MPAPRGADHGPVWDAKKAEAVQAARDRELGDVLAGLARELAANLGPAGDWVGVGGGHAMDGCCVSAHTL